MKNFDKRLKRASIAISIATLLLFLGLKGEYYLGFIIAVAMAVFFGYAPHLSNQFVLKSK
jgi:hypothetical protein